MQDGDEAAGLLTLSELDAADDDALLGRNHVKRGARAPNHARNIVQHGVALVLRPEQLHVRVEQVTLCGVNVAPQHLVQHLHHPRHDGGLADLRRGVEAARRSLALEDDAVELGNVQLVGGRAVWHFELQPLAPQDAVCCVREELLNSSHDSAGVALPDLRHVGDAQRLQRGSTARRSAELLLNQLSHRHDALHDPHHQCRLARRERHLPAGRSGRA